MNKIKTSRTGAIKFVARILKNARYNILVHSNKDCDCKWIEIWYQGAWIGNLNLTLMGTWFTTNMIGQDRKKILQLIPDELEVHPNLSEVSSAKKFDYGFSEEE